MSNNQTWNINLRYDEIFINMIEDQKFDDIDHLAEAFESIVSEFELEGLKENSLAYEVLDCFLNEVDWMELAEHYASDFDLFPTEEEVE